jgi:two-component system, NtrC family, response regulator AtoC
LRFLEKKTFRRLGGTHDISVDARIIAATNRDLRSEVRKGGFREDLFYRLNVIPIHLPALRERADDILLLAKHFLTQFSSRLRRPLLTLSPEARIAFTGYRWPGNVRELRNIIERLVILCPENRIDLTLLPQEMWDGNECEDEPARPAEGFHLENYLLRVELRLVKQALAQSGGHKGQAAQRLGMSRHAFKRRLYKLGLAEELHDD